jgi:two-component system LytT family sensor kinase
MQIEPTEPPPLRWHWIIAIWSGVGLFDATQNVVVMRAEGMQHAWANLFMLLSLSWLPWMLATPMVFRLGARYPLSLRRSSSARAVAVHGATWLVLSALSALWMSGLESLLNPWNPTAPPPSVWPLFLDKAHQQLLSALILYYCILMAGHALASRESLARSRVGAAQLAEQLAKAQLDALRHQVEPHFLFNALNAVSGLVREGRNDKAVETIARISDFLRHTLHEAGAQEVTLAEELTFATMYLDIQKVRFGDRLRIAVDVAPGLERAIVPRLILQPVVENAVKHGIAKRARPGAIEISAVRSADRLALTICNDGPPLPPDGVASPSSIGIANVRSRLRGLHGDGGDLCIRDEPGRGVRVTITVPWRETP